MKITVKYFGMIADELSRKSDVFEFGGETVTDLKSELELTSEKLAKLPYVVAVNQNIATNDKVIKEQDEVALLPPFAGG